MRIRPELLAVHWRHGRHRCHGTTQRWQVEASLSSGPQDPKSWGFQDLISGGLIAEAWAPCLKLRLVCRLQSFEVNTRAPANFHIQETPATFLQVCALMVQLRHASPAFRATCIFLPTAETGGPANNWRSAQKSHVATHETHTAPQSLRLRPEFGWLP